MQDNKTTSPAVTQAQSGLAERARNIDAIAAKAAELFNGAGSFEAELAVAQSIQDLRAALTPEVMRPIMGLMNTDLGFLTDRDPKRPAKNGESVTPYSVEDVRDAIIEAKLRGFHCCGNEFNIISKRFYAAKNGLKRRCETWPGVTNLKILIGLPRNSRDGAGAVVPVVGSWEKDGQKDKIETEVAVKVNAFMGADAVVGKAERKLYKRIFDRLSGRVTPDGDASEDDALTDRQQQPQFLGTPAAEPLPTTVKEAVQALDQPAVTKQAELLATEAPAVAAPKSPDVPPQDTLAGIVVGAGFTYDDFQSWGRVAIKDGNKFSGPAPWDSIDGFDLIPDRLALFCIGQKEIMLSQMTVRAKGGKR